MKLGGFKNIIKNYNFSMTEIPDKINKAIETLSVGNRNFRTVMKMVYLLDPDDCRNENGTLRAEKILHGVSAMVRLGRMIHVADLLGCDNYWESDIGIRLRDRTEIYLRELESRKIKV